jgi:hypothetical protein
VPAITTTRHTVATDIRTEGSTNARPLARRGQRRLGWEVTAVETQRPLLRKIKPRAFGTPVRGLGAYPSAPLQANQLPCINASSSMHMGSTPPHGAGVFLYGAIANFFSTPNRSGRRSGDIQSNNVWQAVADRPEDGAAIPVQPSEPKPARDAVFR